MIVTVDCPWCARRHVQAGQPASPSELPEALRRAITAGAVCAKCLQWAAWIAVRVAVHRTSAPIGGVSPPEPKENKPMNEQERHERALNVLRGALAEATPEQLCGLSRLIDVDVEQLKRVARRCRAAERFTTLKDLREALGRHDVEVKITMANGACLAAIRPRDSEHAWTCGFSSDLPTALSIAFERYEEMSR